MTGLDDIGAVHAVTCTYLDDVQPGPCDCGVPTEIGRLLAVNTALNAVVDLHQPKEFIAKDGRSMTGCGECWTANGSPRPFPCRTVATLLEIAHTA